MSLTPDEQRKLAESCGFSFQLTGEKPEYVGFEEALDSYTYAVEAKRDIEVIAVRTKLAFTEIECAQRGEDIRELNEEISKFTVSLSEEYTDILEAKVRKLEQELQALREQKPVAYMYIDSSGKYSTPMLELKNTVSGYHECWKPYPLYSAPVPAIEWQPIESAPKNGRDILIYDDGITIGSWSNGFNTWNNGEWWIEGGQVTASNATYWMPLPESPKKCT